MALLLTTVQQNKACKRTVYKHDAILNSKFLLSVSTLTGSQEITRTKLIAKSLRIHMFFKEKMVRGCNCWGDKNKTLIKSQLILDF